MNIEDRRFKSLKVLLLLAIFTIASVAFCFKILAPSLAQDGEKREIEDQIPKHLPLKVKLKKEKEEKIKDIGNEQALAEYDKRANGGNRDGVINRQDSIFLSLRLWRDANHNGFSEAAELSTLPQVGLKTLDLDYKTSRRTDQYGNQFRYRAKVKDTHDAQLGRWA